MYAADTHHETVDVWGPGGFYPTVALPAAVSGLAGKSAVLSGTVNPSQQGNAVPAALTECYFRYVSEEKFNQAVAKGEAGFVNASQASCEDPDAAEIPSEPEVVHAVHVNVNGLEPGVTYRYQLVAATDAANKGGVAETGSRAFTAPAPPDVVSSGASNFSTSAVDLSAQIKPHGALTAYHFEYLTAEAYATNKESFSGSAPAQSVPVPDATVGSGGPSGSGLETVVQHLSGLAPDTQYFFRVVAESESTGRASRRTLRWRGQSHDVHHAGSSRAGTSG